MDSSELDWLYYNNKYTFCSFYLYMTVECILTYYTYMENNFPFFWLFMLWKYLGCVFIYEHKKVMSDSFYLSYSYSPIPSFHFV